MVNLSYTISKVTNCGQYAVDEEAEAMVFMRAIGVKQRNRVRSGRGVIGLYGHCVGCIGGNRRVVRVSELEATPPAVAASPPTSARPDPPECDPPV